VEDGEDHRPVTDVSLTYMQLSLRNNRQNRRKDHDEHNADHGGGDEAGLEPNCLGHVEELLGREFGAVAITGVRTHSLRR
jgi:hypothetical protein